MGISVVVPVKDRVEDLTKCLASLESARLGCGSDVGPVEITVVDDGSAVETASLLQASFPDVHFLRLDESHGPAHARNIGLQHAKYDKVAFTDSDCVVGQGWISEAAHSLESPSAVGVQGPPWLYRDMSAWGAHQNSLLEQFFWEGKFREDGSCTTIDSKNVAFRRDKLAELFPDLQLFPEHMTLAAAEDRVAGRDLAAREQVLWNPDMQVFHKNPESFSEIIQQKFRHGRGSWYYFKTDFSIQAKFNKHFLQPVQFGVNLPFVLAAHGAFWMGYLYERFCSGKGGSGAAKARTEEDS